jgi:hypothetical protein
MRSKKEIIRASELGQFHYCSISWYLQKCGYKPKSQRLQFGLDQHKKIGLKLDQIHKKIKRSRIIALLGLFLLVISLISLFFEVIL